MSDAASFYALFISSFLAATLLPGGSEAALFAVLKTNPETLWVALVIAIIGNALGGMVGMGWLRLNWWQAALFLALGKSARYAMIAVAVD